MSFWKSCLWTSSLLQISLMAVCFPWFQLRNGFFDLLFHVPSCLDCSTWNLQTILLPAWEALAAERAACNSLPSFRVHQHIKYHKKKKCLHLKPLILASLLLTCVSCFWVWPWLVFCQLVSLWVNIPFLRWSETACFCTTEPICWTT